MLQEQAPLMNLMKRISDACGSVWDFKLTTDQDNPFQAKIVEDSSTDQPVKDLLNNKSIDSILIGTTNINHLKENVLVLERDYPSEIFEKIREVQRS